MLKKIKIQIHNVLIRKFNTLNRQSIANYYLSGSGLEIGAMEAPLIPKYSTKISYLDRCSKLESAKIFPNLAGKLVDVDIIFNIDEIGDTVIDKFDFIIANHVLEHLEDPISVLKGLLSNIRVGGRIFLSLPDKRYTFDKLRENTTIAHLIDEHENGFLKNRIDHYRDFVINTEHGFGKTEVEIQGVIKHLMDRNFSIHFHVWDHEAYVKFLDAIQVKYNLNFRIIFSKESNGGDNESIFILEKV